MKSELLGPRKLSIDGRQTVQKGEMSKNTTPVENGSVRANVTSIDNSNSGSLTLGMAQEGFKCNKQQDFQQSAADVSEKGDPSLFVDISNAASGRGSKEESMEKRQFQELILLHLDLVQKQQELLLAKDRQIMTLKSEKEAVSL